MMNTILITGGAGFVGANLALGMTERFSNIRVVALDNLHRRGSELNIERLRAHGVTFLHGDVRIKDDLQAVGEFDWMIECSAEPSAAAGHRGSPSYLIGSNLVGMLNCLEAVRERGAGMIFLSTSRVYPIPTLSKLAITETDTRFVLQEDQDVTGASSRGIAERFPLDGRRTLYGATKLCGEIMLQEYIAAHDVRGVVNRCGTIAGPWQMGKVDQGFVSLWVAAHTLELSLAYSGYGGTGKQVRDVLHITDLLDLIVLEMAQIDHCNTEVFNVGGGLAFSTSLRELTALCEEVTGKRTSIASEPDTGETDVPIYISDTGKVSSKLQWAPKRGIEEIVSDIHSWIVSARDKVEAIFTDGSQRIPAK